LLCPDDCWTLLLLFYLRLPFMLESRLSFQTIFKDTSYLLLLRVMERQILRKWHTRFWVVNQWHCWWWTATSFTMPLLSLNVGCGMNWILRKPNSNVLYPEPDKSTVVPSHFISLHSVVTLFSHLQDGHLPKCCMSKAEMLHLREWQATVRCLVPSRLENSPEGSDRLWASPTHPPIHWVPAASAKMRKAGLSLHFSYALMANRSTNLPLRCIYRVIHKSLRDFRPLRYSS
jgi:hypothetical protein